MPGEGKVVVYGVELSQPTRAVLWCLKMKGVAYELRRVNPMKGEAEKDDYLKLFPSGLIPGVIDGDVRLTESHAILTYLAETRGWNDWFPANDVVKRAKINQWLHWHHANVRPITLALVAPFFMSMVQGKPVDPAAAGKLSKTASRLLRNMELVMRHGALKDTPFLCGDSPTLADICIYCEVDQFKGLGLPVDLAKEAPTIAAWAERMERLPHHDEVRAKMAAARKAVTQMLAKL